ncbi:hypothetical protein ACFWAP_00905 [Streptomyces goshikiensis]|uniref:hypothetical protein n=1 Tax=Streptomyces goshikiensis TaxID=1942 RepID=UPI00364BE8B3
MQQIQKLRLVRLTMEGVTALADVAQILTDAGELSLAITTFSSDVEVAEPGADTQLTEGMERKLRIRELMREYQPAMREDEMRTWAMSLVSELEADQMQ